MIDFTFNPFVVDDDNFEAGAPAPRRPHRGSSPWRQVPDRDDNRVEIVPEDKNASSWSVAAGPHLFMALSSACLAIGRLCLKVAERELPTNVAFLLAASVVLVLRTGRTAMQQKKSGRATTSVPFSVLATHGACGGVSLWLGAAALRGLDLSIAGVLIESSPVFSLPLAWAVLGEPVLALDWLSSGLVLAGIACAAQPVLGPNGTVAGMRAAATALFGAFFGATLYVYTGRIARLGGSVRLGWGQALGLLAMMLCVLLLVFASGTPLPATSSFTGLGAAISAGLSLDFGRSLRGTAFANVAGSPAAVLGTRFLLDLPVLILLDCLVLREPLAASTVTGAALVVAGSALISAAQLYKWQAAAHFYMDDPAAAAAAAAAALSSSTTSRDDIRVSGQQQSRIGKGKNGGAHLNHDGHGTRSQGHGSKTAGDEGGRGRRARHQQHPRRHPTTTVVSFLRPHQQRR